MVMEISFERYDDGRWYVVFPEYEGDHEDLEMVEGADKMLDALTDDNLYVDTIVSLEKLPSGFMLKMESHDDFGAFYNVIGCEQFEGNVWLCNVVHDFFGEHPEEIYFRVKN